MLDSWLITSSLWKRSLKKKTEERNNWSTRDRINGRNQSGCKWSTDIIDRLTIIRVRSWTPNNEHIKSRPADGRRPSGMQMRSDACKWGAWTGRESPHQRRRRPRRGRDANELLCKWSGGSAGGTHNSWWRKSIGKENPSPPPTPPTHPPTLVLFLPSDRFPIGRAQQTAVRAGDNKKKKRNKRKNPFRANQQTNRKKEMHKQINSWRARYRHTHTHTNNTNRLTNAALAPAKDSTNEKRFDERQTMDRRQEMNRKTNKKRCSKVTNQKQVRLVGETNDCSQVMFSNKYI